MTVILRGVLIVVSVLLAFFVLRKIRQSKVKIEDSIFWVLFALFMVVFSVFPGVADLLSGLVGTYSTSNFIFMLVIFVLLVKVFFLSVKISQMESRITKLVQLLAIETKEREETEGKNGPGQRVTEGAVRPEGNEAIEGGDG